MPQSDVDKIKSRLSIVDVVSPYVDLKPAGSRLKGLSPFTSEKTPSFFVSPEQGFYHCFSTDQGGDMFKFIQTMEGLDFVGALKLLADKAGVELTNTKSSDSTDKKPLYDALERAAQFFESAYRESTAAQHLVSGRGITDEEVMRFRIGYAPDDWRRLHETLSADFSDQVLFDAGLIKQKNNSTYDVFRDRVMFPIRDIAGRVVGFSGRRLDGDSAAKYLNSPETAVFRKGSELYGLYESKKCGEKHSKLLLVEGYMDVIALAQMGIRNAVATLGTATSVRHLTRMFRQVSEVVFCFDGDDAGNSAAWRALETTLPLMEDGRQVKFLFLPFVFQPPLRLLHYQG